MNEEKPAAVTPVIGLACPDSCREGGREGVQNQNFEREGCESTYWSDPCGWSAKCSVLDNKREWDSKKSIRGKTPSIKPIKGGGI